VKIANQPVTTNASFGPRSGPAIPRPSGLDPSIPMLGGPQAAPQSGPQSAQRQLPDFLTATPQPSAGGAAAPNEPYFRDPATGEIIVLFTLIRLMERRFRSSGLPIN